MPWSASVFSLRVPSTMIKLLAMDFLLPHWMEMTVIAGTLEDVDSEWLRYLTNLGL